MLAAARAAPGAPAGGAGGEDTALPLYLLQVASTPAAWAALARRPGDRFAGVRGLLAGLGGRLAAAFSSFGEDDGVLLAELPDNPAGAAAALTAALRWATSRPSRRRPC